MRSDFDRILRIFPSYTDDGFNYEIPLSLFYQECQSVLVGDFQETIEAMTIDNLISFSFIDPSEGDVVVLTPRGINELRRIYELPENIKKVYPDELQDLINKLKERIEKSENISYQLQKVYISTIEEIKLCLENKCNNAAIAMSGKLLEIFATDILIKNGIKIEPKDYTKNGIPERKRYEITLSELIDKTKTLKQDDLIIDMNKELLHVVRLFRNGSVHYSHLAEEPEDPVYYTAIAFCFHTILKHFST